jgi:methionyl-tRNA formyltransferase
MHKVKIAYFGTPDFSAAFLEMILNDSELPVEVKYVFTQPDARAGRLQKLTPSPARQKAEQYGIHVVTDLNNAQSLLKEVDLALLFAYGKIIPKALLDAPRYGFWNIHPSMLPKYRGPAPMATPLLNGDNETGITLMKMDEEMDHGPIIAQQSCYIFPTWRRDQLEKHLIELSYELFKKILSTYSSDLSSAPFIEQNHVDASYTQRMKKDDGYIPLADLKLSSINQKKEIFNKFRAYYPWPGVWTKIMINGSEKRVKLTKIHWENGDLVIKKVQLEGKNEVEYAQFMKAYASLTS